MPIEILSVNCNHCGAPLRIPAETRFVTCQHCGSQLELCRTGDAAYTQVLEQVDQRTQQIAVDLEAIKRQGELDRIDREWSRQRETLLRRSKNGSTSVPSAGFSVAAAAFAAIFGLCWTIGASSHGAPGFFTLFGVVFIGVAIYGGIAGVNQATAYRDAEARYQQDRERLVRENQRNST